LINSYIEYYASVDSYIKNLISKDDMGCINIQTNTSCNMSCSYCYQKSTSSGFSINDKNIDELINKIEAFFKKREEEKNNTYTKITFIGGEISINNNIIEIYRRIKKLKIKERIIFQLITNGFYFNEDFRNFLKEISSEKDLYITVSLDLKSMHNKYRLGNKQQTYDNIIGNIEYLNSLNIIVRRNIVFTKEYFGLSPLDIVNEIKSTYKYFFEVFLIYEDSLMKHKLNEKEKKFLIEFYNLIKDELNYSLKNKKRFKFSTPGFSIESYIYGLVYINRNYCTAHKNTISFSPDKNNELIENICSRYAGVNKENKGMQIMMKNNPLHKIVKDIINNSDCCNCYLKPFCKQACFYLEFNNLHCIEFKKFLATIHKNILKKVAKTENFFKIFVEYLKEYNDEGAYNSYLQSKEFWKIRYKEILDVNLEVNIDIQN